MIEPRAGLRRALWLLLALAALAGIAGGAYFFSTLLRRGAPPEPPPLVSFPSPEARPTPLPSSRETPLAKRGPESAAPTFPAPSAAPPRAPPLLATPRSVATRSGGRLVAALRDQAYYVRYEPMPGLRLDRFARALGAKAFGFEVLSFEALASDPILLGFHVERAGEIVAASIALQLEQMGFRAGIELDQALAPLRAQLGDRFRINLKEMPWRAKFSGTVRFVVLHARAGDDHETRAELNVALDLTDTFGRPLYRRSLDEAVTKKAPALEGHAERGRAAAAAVLQSFIRNLFGDPELEQSLVRYIAKARPSSP